MAQQNAEYEYIVVGSGAGGGTVAARLAEEGFRVLLLEAGGDPMRMEGADPISNPPAQNRLPADYEVPAFHAFSSENDAMRWNYFVRHYRDDALQRDDPKYRETYEGQRVDGVLYPRAGCLGGCTAHNAMIMIYPHNKDWSDIEELTDDHSWSPDNMRRYFEQMENCRHRLGWRILKKLTGINPTRHGFNGWLSTEKAIPRAAVKSQSLKTFLIDTVAAETEDLSSSLMERLYWFILGHGDPNDWRLVGKNSTGIRYAPLATHKHARNGSRERVAGVAKEHPTRLTVELDALATKVLLDDTQRAIGVEYLKGARLYRAHQTPSAEAGQTRQVYASREVILAGGAFNTPQLLMLSGIGPRAELEKHGIKVLVQLDGVGTNLQDRYEVGLVNRMNFKSWDILKGAKFAPGDPYYKQWKSKRKGVYTTNGSVAAIVRRSLSLEKTPLPDLFLFALLGNFRGYFPGYSKPFATDHNYLTWCILKAHTKNCAGTVRLRSDNPRDTPLIDFCYFTEGNDKDGGDLKSVVAGIRFARRLTDHLREKGLIAEEELPGQNLQSDDELADFAKKHAWGHHASCSCRIGPREQGGVVNGNFEVHGTRGLRIVDASVFPKIPGFFIATSVYMIGEKAADVIADAARRHT